MSGQRLKPFSSSRAHLVLRASLLEPIFRDPSQLDGRTHDGAVLCFPKLKRAAEIKTTSLDDCLKPAVVWQTVHCINHMPWNVKKKIWTMTFGYAARLSWMSFHSRNREIIETIMECKLPVTILDNSFFHISEYYEITQMGVWELQNQTKSFKKVLYLSFCKAATLCLDYSSEITCAAWQPKRLNPKLLLAQKTTWLPSTSLLFLAHQKAGLISYAMSAFISVF